jgi:hypothetical protein
MCMYQLALISLLNRTAAYLNENWMKTCHRGNIYTPFVTVNCEFLRKYRIQVERDGNNKLLTIFWLYAHEYEHCWCKRIFILFCGSMEKWLWKIFTWFENSMFELIFNRISFYFTADSLGIWLLNDFPVFFFCNFNEISNCGPIYTYETITLEFEFPTKFWIVVISLYWIWKLEIQYL